MSFPGLHPSYLCACVHEQQVTVAFVLRTHDKCSNPKAKNRIRHKSLSVGSLSAWKDVQEAARVHRFRVKILEDGGR